MRYFEDLIAGERLNCPDIVMTREAIIAFARQFDPQPFHTDERAAKKSVFAGLVASSLHTLSACTRTVVAAQGQMAVLSGIGMEEVKMFHPVRPDDILSVEAWWTGLRKSEKKPDRGFAVIRCKVSNQKGEPVMEYGYKYLIACRKID